MLDAPANEVAQAARVSGIARRERGAHEERRRRRGRLHASERAELTNGARQLVVWNRIEDVERDVLRACRLCQ